MFLDVGNEIFVWVGLKASAQERKMAMGTAQKYLQDKNLPNWLPITRILEGGENEVSIFLPFTFVAWQYSHSFTKGLSHVLGRREAPVCHWKEKFGPPLNQGLDYYKGTMFIVHLSSQWMFGCLRVFAEMWQKTRK